MQANTVKKFGILNPSKNIKLKIIVESITEMISISTPIMTSPLVAFTIGAEEIKDIHNIADRIKFFFFILLPQILFCDYIIGNYLLIKEGVVCYGEQGNML